MSLPGASMRIPRTMKSSCKKCWIHKVFYVISPCYLSVFYFYRSEVLDLVVRCKKEFRNACPVYWYNLCKCLVQHGANVTYKEPGQEFLLVTLTCNLQALLPWSSAELRNNYINVIELLSTPETVESSQPDSMSALQYLVVLSGNIFTKPGSAKTVTQMLDTMLKFCQDPKYQL